MERLTKRIDDNHACFAICEKECPDGIYADNPACMCTAGVAALKRLMEYEDTGLTPEQIQELKDRDVDKMSIGVDKGYIPPWVMEIVKKHLSDPITDTNVGDSGWTPCSEQMPEPGEHVLVSFKCSGFIPVMAFLSESKRWLMLQGANGFNDITNAVSAWRPLPEPYKPHAESREQTQHRTYAAMMVRAQGKQMGGNNE